MTPEREAELRSLAARWQEHEQQLREFHDAPNWEGIARFLIEALDAVAKIRHQNLLYGAYASPASRSRGAFDALKAENEKLKTEPIGCHGCTHVLCADECELCEE